MRAAKRARAIGFRHISLACSLEISFSLCSVLSLPRSPPTTLPLPYSLSCVAILLCKLYVSPHNNVNRAGNSLAASREAASFMVRGSASETFDRILMYLGHDAAFNAYSWALTANWNAFDRPVALQLSLWCLERGSLPPCIQRELLQRLVLWLLNRIVVAFKPLECLRDSKIYQSWQMSSK